MRHTDESGSASTVDVDSIIPEAVLQQAADEHDVAPDALRAALRRDLGRNQRMADRILDRRPVVHETDDYSVVRASEGVTDETPLPVLAVYRAMDDSDTDYAAGYPLVVPHLYTDTDDLDGFQNVSEMEGDDDE
ncbi:hypothetical protein [Haloferax volcanii]|uniref:hypothetical protein n=1 Tax=Haloferax volcanii TaxID=2246 RepID=UPI0006778059|nr:hypothetical protein [Haloferax alexandrinus]